MQPFRSPMLEMKQNMILQRPQPRPSLVSMVIVRQTAAPPGEILGSRAQRSMTRSPWIAALAARLR